MPSQEAVRSQLAQIVSAVLGSDESAVKPGVTFKDLGADSLTIVEIGEELGRRFDVYLPDETINEFTTVDDAIRAIVTPLPIPKGRVAPPIPASVTTPVPVATTPEPSRELTGPIEPAVAEKRAKSAAKWLVGVGALVGIAAGVVFSLLVGASGIDEADLPPLPSATPKPTPTETPTPEPTPTPTPTPTESKDPVLQVENPTQIQPGVNFPISGRFPELDAGAPLLIETRTLGGQWENFPYVFETLADGEFRTKIRTQTIGEREIRIRHAESNSETNGVKIRIG